MSNKEQLPVVLRYVDENGTVQERNRKFLHCETGLSGQALSTLIMEGIRNLGLDMECCRGQGYDGAGNMSGKYQGAASLIQNDYHRAIYVNCAAHRLNLCVTHSSKLFTLRTS